MLRYNFSYVDIQDNLSHNVSAPQLYLINKPRTEVCRPQVPSTQLDELTLVDQTQPIISSGQGCQVWTKSGSDWTQIGQIRDFLRSDFSTFWLVEPKYIDNWS